MKRADKVVLYILVDYSSPIFIGLAWIPEFDKRISEHRREIPVAFGVQIAGTFSSLYSAQHEARQLIQRYHTQRFGFNKTDYGDLDNKPRVNTGGYRWNGGVDSRTLPKYDQSRKDRSLVMSEVARLNNYESRLPFHAGESHPMKREECRDKLRNTSNGRRRYYFDDNRWTWCYAGDHPLAFRNRENGIPNLEDVSPERFSKKV